MSDLERELGILLRRLRAHQAALPENAISGHEFAAWSCELVEARLAIARERAAQPAANPFYTRGGP